MECGAPLPTSRVGRYRRLVTTVVSAPKVDTGIAQGRVLSYLSFDRVGFRLIAEFGLRRWLFVLRNFVFLCGPGASAA